MISYLPLRVPIVLSFMKKLSGRPWNSSLRKVSFIKLFPNTTTTYSRPSFKPITSDLYILRSSSNARCWPPLVFASLDN